MNKKFDAQNTREQKTKVKTNERQSRKQQKKKKKTRRRKESKVKTAN